MVMNSRVDVEGVAAILKFDPTVTEGGQPGK